MSLYTHTYEDIRKKQEKNISNFRWGLEEDFYIQKLFLKFGSFNEICFYECRVIFIMQISFFAKVVLFLALYCISDISIKNNIFKKVINRANMAKKV